MLTVTGTPPGATHQMKRCAGNGGNGMQYRVMSTAALSLDQFKKAASAEATKWVKGCTNASGGSTQPPKRWTKK